jgi:DNA-binding response OmpR family regulator
VVCSFQANPSTQLAATLAGADVYLTKPFSPGDLASVCATSVTASPKAPDETQPDLERHMTLTDDDQAVTSARLGDCLLATVTH